MLSATARAGMRTRAAAWLVVLAIVTAYRIGHLRGADDAAGSAVDAWGEGYARGMQHGREMHDARIRRALRRAGVQVVGS